VGLDGPDRFAGYRGVDVVDDHCRALAGEFPGVSEPQAASASGDNRYFS
jgi:hypothetical protein